jgi:hypothetical protein
VQIEFHQDNRLDKTCRTGRGGGQRARRDGPNQLPFCLDVLISDRFHWQVVFCYRWLQVLS